MNVSGVAEFAVLLGFLVPLATEMLEEHGSFLPCGGAVGPDGEFVPIDSDYDLAPPDIIERLQAQFVDGAKSGSYIATALVYDAFVTDPSDGTKSDAIIVSLDHKNGMSQVIAVPYKLTDGTVTTGKLISQDGSGSVFAAA